MSVTMHWLAAGKRLLPKADPVVSSIVELLRERRRAGLKRKDLFEQPARQLSRGQSPELRIPCIWGIEIATDNRT
jgi:hypothetical protein